MDSWTAVSVRLQTTTRYMGGRGSEMYVPWFCVLCQNSPHKILNQDCLATT